MSNEVHPVFAAFRGRWRARGGGEEALPRGLERSLDDLVRTAAAAWPDVELDPQAFARHIADRLTFDKPLAAQLELLRSSDLYLACACAAGLPAALAAFDQRFLPAIGSYLASMRPSATFVDEMRQMLREKLLVAAPGGVPKIGEYSGRGALATWLRVTAVRTAIDLRRQKSEVLSGESDEQGEPTPSTPFTDPEIDFIKQRYRHAFESALRTALDTLPAEQREILRLHFGEGVSLDELGARYGKHRATPARWIASARVAIYEEVRRLLALAPDDFQSLAGLMRSQLDVSIISHLKKKSP